MTSSFAQKSDFDPNVIARYSVFALAGLTFGLMALGSTTRVMNAGLACPDWPLCYGEMLPASQMNLQVFLEWFHRLVASTVGFMTLVFTGFVWWNRLRLAKWLPWASTFALLLVVFQGILGGLTVTELLRFDIVTAHLGTGLLFFATLLATGMTLLPFRPLGTSKHLSWISGLAIVLVYGQCLLGALVASQWAVHQCLASDELCSVLNTHFIGVVPASLATILVVAIAWWSNNLHPWLQRLAYSAGVCLLLQIGLGMATYRLQLQIAPLTVMHQAVGAALLGTLVAFCVLAIRDREISSRHNTFAT